VQTENGYNKRNSCLPFFLHTNTLLHGIFNPRIVLLDIELTTEELQCVFLHELTVAYGAAAMFVEKLFSLPSDYLAFLSVLPQNKF